MDAAEHDDIGMGGGGLLGEAEGIADVIGDVLDFGDLIVVGEDDGVELLLEGEDFLGEGIGGRNRGDWAGGKAVDGAGGAFGEIDHGREVTGGWRVNSRQGAGGLGWSEDEALPGEKACADGEEAAGQVGIGGVEIEEVTGGGRSEDAGEGSGALNDTEGGALFVGWGEARDETEERGAGDA
jgi:hypothetical protein